MKERKRKNCLIFGVDSGEEIVIEPRGTILRYFNDDLATCIILRVVRILDADFLCWISVFELILLEDLLMYERCLDFNLLVALAANGAFLVEGAAV